MFFVVSVASYSLLVCLLFQMEYKVKPFFDCCLSFLGFSTDEQKHMEELTVQNGNHTHASTHTLDPCAHSPHLLFLPERNTCGHDIYTDSVIDLLSPEKA